MNTENYLDSMPISELALTVARNVVIEEFENALNVCLQDWRNGETSVVLSHNFHTRFGTLLLNYFQSCLVNCIGEPIELTLVDNGDGPKTAVQMPKYNVTQSVAQVQPTISPWTKTSDHDVPKISTAAIVTKKAPRPMNCWIIFRDAMHKQLKFDHPELSVQEICKHKFPPRFRPQLLTQS
jgi:hypothetical protein